MTTILNPFIISQKSDGTTAIDSLTEKQNQELRRVSWASNWTSLVTFSVNQQSYLLSYKQGDGTVAIDRLNSDGSTEEVHRHKIESGWTHLVVLSINNKNYLFTYRYSVGTVAFFELGINGVGKEFWRKTWSVDWTNFNSFVHEGGLYLLQYKNGKGDAVIDILTEEGNKEVFRTKWAGDWTNFASFAWKGKSYLFSYKHGVGTASLDEITPSGTTSQGRFGWATDWSLFDIVYLNGHPHLYSYKNSDGTFCFDKVNDDVKNTTELWRKKWANDWRRIVPFHNPPVSDVKPAGITTHPVEKNRGKYHLIAGPTNGHWEDYQDYARYHGGRLPSNEEVKYWLHGEPYPGLVKRDTWIPTYNEKLERDWIQISDNRFGYSHNVLYGYPAWGNARDYQVWKGFILIIEDENAKVTPLHLVRYSANKTWDDFNEYSKTLGGRLPSYEEVKEWLHGEPYKPLYLKDTWVPVLNNGQKDWVQIGDARFGWSHKTTWTYPAWGNTEEASPWKGFILLFKEDYQQIGTIHYLPNNSTWEDFNIHARALGGRLPTNDEVGKWLDGKAYPPVNGRDAWIPTVPAPDQRDWIQIGDTRFGQSHVKNYGYPGWGDKRDAAEYKGLFLVIKEGVPPKRPNFEVHPFSPVTNWENTSDISQYYGFRIPKIDEVRFWLAGEPYKHVRGKDTWIPVLDGTGKRDWLQIGDTRFGYSHTQLYGYPAWGDNHDETVWKGLILVESGLTSEYQNLLDQIKKLEEQKKQLEEKINAKKREPEPLPKTPEVDEAKQRVENGKNNTASLPHANLNDLSSVTEGIPLVVDTPKSFQFFETFTKNGNVVVPTKTPDGKQIFEVVVPPGGKYGKDVIYYWDDNKRHEIPFTVLPSEEKRFSKSYEIKNAQTNEFITTSEVTLINSTGGIVAKLENKNGRVTLPDVLPDGAYVLKFESIGFSNHEVHGVVYENAYKKIAVLPVFLSKILQTGERRFVLRWSEPKAKDLDLHILGSDNTHVFYGKKKFESSENNVNFTIELDIDVRTGLGPETITLTNLKPGVKYSILVQNFDQALPLSTTGAKVNFFESGKTHEISVPNNGDVTSVWWLVGGLLDTGEFLPFNQLRAGITQRAEINAVKFDNFPWPQK